MKKVHFDAHVKESKKDPLHLLIKAAKALEPLKRVPTPRPDEKQTDNMRKLR